MKERQKERERESERKRETDRTLFSDLVLWTLSFLVAVYLIRICIRVRGSSQVLLLFFFFLGGGGGIGTGWPRLGFSGLGFGSPSVIPGVGVRGIRGTSLNSTPPSLNGSQNHKTLPNPKLTLWGCLGLGFSEGFWKPRPLSPRRVQYVIEGLYETRRKKFSDHPMATWRNASSTDVRFLRS